MNYIDLIRRIIVRLKAGEILPRNHVYATVALLLGLSIVNLPVFSSKPSQADLTSLAAIEDGGQRQVVALSRIAPLLPGPAAPHGTSALEEALNLANEAVPAPVPTPAAPAEAEVEIAATENVAVEAVVEQDTRIFTPVEPGDNLTLLFSRVGLTPQDVYRVANSGGDADILARLHPGYTLAFDIDDSGSLRELEIIKNQLESYQFTLNANNGFDVRHLINAPEIVPVYKEATIQNSLFLAAQQGGIPDGLTMQIATIFGGVIDFMLDTRAGDSFKVLYEERHFNGEFIGTGAIQAVQYTNRGQTFTALRYENANGDVDFYNPEGESMRKAFLRNPVDFVRISSNFNPNRRHPILNTIRAHKGTDYAAPTGTPVVATSDGRVTWAGRNGSFGNLVVIQHGERFETKYAHLSRYANGIREGSRVKQGQVIGYVGATGGATGPHLHYEFLMDGVHRDARRIHEQLPKAESVPAGELDRFRQHTSAILARLNSYAESDSSTLAVNTVSGND